jgi:hypothetical protein
MTQKLLMKILKRVDLFEWFYTYNVWELELIFQGEYNYFLVDYLLKRKFSKKLCKHKGGSEYVELKKKVVGISICIVLDFFNQK